MIIKRLGKLLHIALSTGLIGRNARYIPTVLNNFFNTYLLNRLTIVGLEVSIDFRCNLECNHCATNIFKSQLKEKEKDTLSTNDIKSLIDQTKKLHGYMMVFIGGEPLLRKDLDELINYTYQQKMIPFLFTNATLITDKRAKELKKAGLFGALVSIYGMGDHHDRVTNVKGSFEKTVHGIENLKKEGIYIKIGLVPTRENIRSGELEKTILWCESNELDAKFNLIMPVGMLGKANAESILLEEEDLNRIKELYHKYIWITDDMVIGRNAKRCPAGNYGLEVSEFGDVFPCFFIHISYGNVKEQSLEDIVRKMRESPYFNKLHHDHCIAATNREFINNYMQPIWNTKDYPLRVEEHPMYDRKRLGDHSL